MKQFGKYYCGSGRGWQRQRMRDSLNSVTHFKDSTVVFICGSSLPKKSLPANTSGVHFSKFN